MRKQTVESKLTDLERTYQEGFEDLAKSVKSDLVDPFCARHDLTFRSGMGMFGFWLDEADLDDNEVRDLAGGDAVLDTLELATLDGDYLGCQLNDD